MVHLKRNILNKIKPTHKSAVLADLAEIFTVGHPTDTRYKVKQRLERFLLKWAEYYPFLGKLAQTERLEYYFTYLNFDYRIREMIYTTNWIERLNKDFRHP